MIKTARIVSEVTTECYESICEWSPLLINGSCSTEEPEDNQDGSNDPCESFETYTSREDSCQIRQLELNPRRGERICKQQVTSEDVIEFSRLELTDQASGDCEATDTENDTSATDVNFLVGGPKRCNSSLAIKSRSADSFRVLSAEAITESSDSENHSEASMLGSGSMVNKKDFALEQYTPKSTCARDINRGHPFVVALDSALRGETVYSIRPNDQLPALNSAAVSNTTDELRAVGHAPNIQAAEMTVQNRGVSHERRSEDYATVRVDFNPFSLREFGIAEEERMSDSEEKMYEFGTLPIGDSATADERDRSSDEMQYFICSPIRNLNNWPSRSCKDADGTFLYQPAWAEDVWTSSSDSDVEESCSLVMDFRDVLHNGDNSSTIGTDGRGIQEFGVAAKSEPSEDKQQHSNKIKARTAELDCEYENSLPPSNKPNLQEVRLYKTVAVHSQYDYDFDADAGIETNGEEFKSERDRVDFYVVDYDESESEVEVETVENHGAFPSSLNPSRAPSETYSQQELLVLHQSGSRSSSRSSSNSLPSAATSSKLFCEMQMTAETSNAQKSPAEVSSKHFSGKATVNSQTRIQPADGGAAPDVGNGSSSSPEEVIDDRQYETKGWVSASWCRNRTEANYYRSPADS